jgi:hypothetical protein
MSAAFVDLPREEKRETHERTRMQEKRAGEGTNIFCIDITTESVVDKTILCGFQSCPRHSKDDQQNTSGDTTQEQQVPGKESEIIEKEEKENRTKRESANKQIQQSA